MIEKPATHMIAIGGSAGAYELIVELLESLPAHFSVAIVVVLHRNSKYETKIESSLSKRLNKKVISVKDKMTVLPDNIYFAPPGYHLLIEPHFSFSLISVSRCNFQGPLSMYYSNRWPTYTKIRVPPSCCRVLTPTAPMV